MKSYTSESIPRRGVYRMSMVETDNGVLSFCQDYVVHFSSQGVTSYVHTWTRGDGPYISASTMDPSVACEHGSSIMDSSKREE